MEYRCIVDRIYPDYPIVYGVLFQRVLEGRPRLSSEELLGALPILLGIVIFSLGWAIVWTKYFKESVRVRNTFS